MKKLLFLAALLVSASVAAQPINPRISGGTATGGTGGSATNIGVSGSGLASVVTNGTGDFVVVVTPANVGAVTSSNTLSVIDPLIINHPLIDWYFDILSGGGNSLVVYQTGGSATPLFRFTDGGYFVPLNGYIGDGTFITNLHGANIQILTISNAAIANATISTNKMDATAYAAFIGGGTGTTYTNNTTDLPGVIIGSGIGTNLTIVTNIATQAAQDATNATSIRAITAQQTNAPALSNMLNASFVSAPTNSGTDGQIISKTGNKFKFIDDATAAGGLSASATNDFLYTTAVISKNSTTNLVITAGTAAGIGGGQDELRFVNDGSEADHMEFIGNWLDVNVNQTNANLVHFHGVTVFENADNMVFQSGTMSLPATTLTANMNAAGKTISSVDSIDVTNTMTINNLTLTNLGGTGPFLAISNNIVVKTNIPAGGAGDAVLSASQTWTGVNTFSNKINMDAAHALYLSNLTTSRVLMYSTANGVTNTGVTGPLLGTGAAAAASDINTLFPTALLTNSSSTAWSINGSSITNLGAANIATGGVLPVLSAGSLTNLNYNSATNTWTINTAFPVGQTNMAVSIGTATGGITGIANGPASGNRWGELIVFATGTVTFTNPVGVRFSDGLTSRTITNGTSAVISVKVWSGFKTNAAIVHFP